MDKVWQKTKEELRYGGYRKVGRWTYDIASETSRDFDIFLEGGTVCVLALTPDNSVILVRQFRPGPMKYLIDLPGGSVDKGEDYAAAIARELLEETGYTGQFKLAGTEFRNAYSDRISYNYVATQCYKAQEPKYDSNEEIEVVVMSLAEFRQHIKSGQLTDVSTAYMGLDFLNLL